MKKENLILTLMFGLMLAISAILLAMSYVFPTSAVDKMFGQSVHVVNVQQVIDPEYIEIFEKGEVETLAGKKIADIYTARVDHTYFYLELYIAIDADGKVYVRDKFVNPKDDTSASYFGLVREYLLKNYEGIYYENVQFVDGAAGATTIVVSRSIIKNLVSKVVVYHVGKPVDYIEALFGSDYVLNSESTSGIVTTYNVSVEGSDYKVYKAEDSGTYFDFQNTNEGSITIYIAVDNTGEITHVLMPEALYGHSGGNFYSNTNNFLNGALGMNLNDPMPDATTGPTDNSDGSEFLVNKLLQAIQGVV